MSDVKRYPAKMYTPETPCVHATDYDAAQSELAALREELESTKAALREEMKDAFEFQQRNAGLVDLLDEVLNEVPHGWGASFSESDLAERIRQAIKPIEPGASE